MGNLFIKYKHYDSYMYYRRYFGNSDRIEKKLHFQLENVTELQYIREF